MMEGNPYRAAGTFTGSTYVRRQADQDLVGAIYENSRYPYVLAGRQNGKSSLLAATASRLKEYRFVFIDLSVLTERDLADYDRFLAAVAAQALDSDHSKISNVADIVEKLIRCADTKLVVVIDEVDVLVTAYYRNGFFGEIRSLFNRRAREPILNRVQFILVGALCAEELIDDPYRSPFNIGQQIHLDPFDIEQIAQLCQPLTDMGVTVPIRELLRQTGGGVYLCQYILESLWRQTQTSSLDDIDGEIGRIVDVLVRNAPEIAHFADIRRAVERKSDLLEAASRLSSGQPCGSASMRRRLEVIGIFDMEGGFKNPIYERVFSHGGGLAIPPTVEFHMTQYKKFGRLWHACLIAAIVAGITYLTSERRWLGASVAALAVVAVFLRGPILRWGRKLYSAVFSRYQSKYRKHLEYRFRTYRTQGLKTRGAFTPDLEKIYVPLRISPNSPNQITSNLIGKGSTLGNKQIWDFLAKGSDQAFRRIAILARPGAGKTTLLEHLALVFARGVQHRFHPNVPRLLPIILYLRDIRDRITSAPAPTLAELISERLSVMGPDAGAVSPPSWWFDDQLRQDHSACLVMFDGLDEVADANQRAGVSLWVSQQMRRYSEARFIVTSRPHGWLTAPVAEVTAVVQVEPFSFRDARTFVANWYLENERMREQRRMDTGIRMEAERRARVLTAEIERSAVLSELCVNPLLLTMITTVHDNQGTLPENRLALYKEIVEVLLSRRQKEKGLTDSLKSAQKQNLLQILAFELMQAKTRTFDMTNAEHWLGSVLNEMADSNWTTAILIETIAQQSGLLVEREQDEFEFCHKSLQEYLAATQIKDSSREDVLINNLSDGWWEESIRLYAAQADTSGIIRAALANPSVTTLALAYNCMREGLRTRADLRKELEDAVENDLESHDPGRSQLAAEVILAQRLRSMIRLNARIDLDLTLITNAEYQLFLNSTGSNFRYIPHHWEGTHFPQGRARDAISGITPEASCAFCGWLTQLNRNKLVIESYRPPTVDEIGGTPIVHHALGFWYKCDDLWRLGGISNEALVACLGDLEADVGVASCLPPPSEIGLRASNLDVSPYLVGKFDLPIAFIGRCSREPDTRRSWCAFIGAYAVMRALSVATWRALEIASDLNLDPELDFDGDLNRALARAIDVGGALCLAIDLRNALDFARDPSNTPGSIWKDDPGIALASAHDLFLNLKLEIDFELVRARVKEKDRLLVSARKRVIDLGQTLCGSLKRAVADADMRAEALNLDLSLDLDVDRARVLVQDVDFRRDLDLALNRASLRARAFAGVSPEFGCNSATVFGYFFDQLNQWQNSDSGEIDTGMPLPLLVAALKASKANAQYSSLLFSRDHLRSGMEEHWQLQKGETENFAPWWDERAKKIDELLAIAGVYTRRHERKHPGWEGIRIVRETVPE